MSKKNEAWADFWSRQRAGGATGCLPARWQSVFAVLEGRWRAVAQDLAPGAKVLDLATGDARVLHWLGRANPQLERTGIDLCPDLPPGPPDVHIRAGIAMERLPFEDAAFDAIVSQFGVEYGDTVKVAAEVARVACDDARIAFVIHRGDGAILAHNMARAGQICWVIDEIGLFAATRTAIENEAAPWEAAATLVAARVAEGRQRYGDQSAGWEIPEAVRRSLLMASQAGDTAQGLSVLLDSIEDQARNELARIASLESACRTADAREALLGAFDAAGIVLDRSEELHDAAGRLFAEMLHFRRT